MANRQLSNGFGARFSIATAATALFSVVIVVMITARSLRLIQSILSSSKCPVGIGADNADREEAGGNDEGEQDGIFNSGRSALVADELPEALNESGKHKNLNFYSPSECTRSRLMVS